MFDWIVVGLIVAIAAVMLGRSLFRTVTDTRPTCACGHAECPLIGECAHQKTGMVEGRPENCPLTTGDVSEPVNS